MPPGAPWCPLVPPGASPRSTYQYYCRRCKTNRCYKHGSDAGPKSSFVGPYTTFLFLFSSSLWTPWATSGPPIDPPVPPGAPCPPRAPCGPPLRTPCRPLGPQAPLRAPLQSPRAPLRAPRAPILCVGCVGLISALVGCLTNFFSQKKTKRQTNRFNKRLSFFWSQFGAFRVSWHHPC